MLMCDRPGVPCYYDTEEGIARLAVVPDGTGNWSATTCTTQVLDPVANGEIEFTDPNGKTNVFQPVHHSKSTVSGEEFPPGQCRNESNNHCGLDAVERDGGDAFQTWIRHHDEYISGPGADQITRASATVRSAKKNFNFRRLAAW